MKRHLLFRIITVIPLICIMIMIWGLSNSNSDESSSLSITITKKIVEILFGNNISNTQKYNYVSWLHAPIRKMAHITEYALLAICCYIPMYYNLFYNNIIIGLNKTKRTIKIKQKKNITIYVLIFCILYAISDEIHQVFVSGRACRILDVLIDTFGSTLGITLIHLVSNIYDNYILKRIKY